MDLPSGKRTEFWALVAYYASLGFILPAGVVAGYLLGWYADRWLHTSPVLAVVLAFLGAVAGFIEVLRILQRAEKRAEGNDINHRTGSS